MNSQSKTSLSNSANSNPDSETLDFIEQVRVNQEKLAKELKPPLRLDCLRVRFFRLGGLSLEELSTVIEPFGSGIVGPPIDE